MKRKFISGLLLIPLIAITLTGCSGDEEINQLTTMSALNSESSVTSSYSLSWADEQEMVYAQVSDRQLLDLSALSACSDNEIQQVRSFMDLIDNQLIGQIDTLSYTDELEKYASQGLVVDNAILDTKLTDYLLTFFERTPYYWQRTKTTIRGIDSKSHSIIVDVTYKTIDFEKEVKSDSSLVLGDPNYDTLVASRYRKWLNIVDLRVNNPTSDELPNLEDNFLKYWGDIDEIIEEQNTTSNTAQIYQSGNQKTYSGLIDSEAEQSGGSVTVRYVLVPNYVLGLNLGLSCEHMYITDFSLDNDYTDDLSAFTDEGYQTVTDSIFELIYSYFTCIDESDYDGLYKLTNNFGTLDKYYQDLFNSSYIKHEGYSVSLFDITGTHITCGVTISTKERAKNSNITMPVYTDRYYVEIELVDDTLKIDNLVLLSRKLEGEPAISEDDVDESGFTAIIDLDNDDKVEIEKLICNFSALQLNGDTTSDDFSNVVDTSISTNQLSSLKTNMTSLSGAQKVVYLLQYQQGTSNYASVRCREMFQDSTNAISEANVTYEFILKGGRWYIYNYDVNSSVRLNTTNLQTTGSLCLVEPGNVVSYTSQIKGSTSTNLDEVSDISVSFDHAEYTPELKEGVKEQGLVLYTSDDAEDAFDDLVYIVATNNVTSYEDFKNIMALVEANVIDTEDEYVVDEVYDAVYSAFAYYMNDSYSRFSTDTDKLEAQDIAVDKLKTARTDVNARLANVKRDDESYTAYTSLSSFLDSINLVVK
jgi:hypothetical protein